MPVNPEKSSSNHLSDGLCLLRCVGVTYLCLCRERVKRMSKDSEQQTEDEVLTSISWSQGCRGGGGRGGEITSRRRGGVAMTTGPGSRDLGGGCASGRRLLPRSVSFFSSAPIQRRELCAFQIPVSVVKCMRPRNPNTTRPRSTTNRKTSAAEADNTARTHKQRQHTNSANTGL